MNTALLIMDFQASILANYPDPQAIIGRVNKAITQARSRNIPVVYVIVGFREGLPEMSTNNKMYNFLKERVGNAGAEQWMKIHEDLQPQEKDLVVVKRRASAFTGSDLEVVLRSQNIRHLVLSGVATSGVVLSTTREAADKDYQLTILSDCCADIDPEVHKVLTEKVFVRQADVITVDEWIKQ